MPRGTVERTCKARINNIGQCCNSRIKTESRASDFLCSFEIIHSGRDKERLCMNCFFTYRSIHVFSHTTEMCGIRQDTPPPVFVFSLFHFFHCWLFHRGLRRFHCRFLYLRFLHGRFLRLCYRLLRGLFHAGIPFFFFHCV